MTNGVTSYAATENRGDGIMLEVRVTVLPEAAYDDQLELTEIAQMGLVQLHRIIERNLAAVREADAIKKHGTGDPWPPPPYRPEPLPNPVERGD